MSTGGSGPNHKGLLPDTTLADLALAWPERDQEAAHLAAAGYRAMAAALRCYALEIRLKTIICQRLDLNELPRACKTHDLMELIIFTGLWEELQDPANYAVVTHWYTLVDFNRNRLNEIRYRPDMSVPIGESDDVDAALDDPQSGVLAWLSRPR